MGECKWIIDFSNRKILKKARWWNVDDQNIYHYLLNNVEDQTSVEYQTILEDYQLIRREFTNSIECWYGLFIELISNWVLYQESNNWTEKKSDTSTRKKSYRYCECPKCGRRSPLYPSRRGDTYLFHCPRQTCSMGSVTSTTWSRITVVQTLREVERDQVEKRNPMDGRESRTVAIDPTKNLHQGGGSEWFIFKVDDMFDR